MTGTPLDLTPFGGGVLAAIGWLLWLAISALLAVAWWLPKTRWQKIAAVAFVVAGFYVVIVRPIRAELAQQRQAQAKLDESMALFMKRCETAGEKVTRTVENVDGVVWMKWREKYSNADNFADQFKLNDPYGNDCGAEDCILKLLKATKGLDLDPKKEVPHHRGYRFVETRDPRDGILYRYTLRLDRPFDRDHKWLESFIKPELDREPTTQLTARYAITWDDISTRDDREHWIAGSSLKVIDLQTNEAIAERIGYMVDRGQGSQAGFRSPWLLAVQTACPEFPTEPTGGPHGRSLHETPDFLIRILKPRTGE